jgi:FKBP-type peptidyl-prolyl cis-trans isomerase FkpA
MKKTILVLALIGTISYIFSCTKATSGYYSCSGPSAASDSTALKAYAINHGITPEADTSGLYYQIIDTGSGPNPIGRNKITVSYIGKYLTGEYLDSTTSPVTLELDSLIKGWQYGLPKIRPGGRIKLLIPSALAFGCTGSNNVPANTPLYFDVSLINVGY